MAGGRYLKIKELVCLYYSCTRDDCVLKCVIVTFYREPENHLFLHCIKNLRLIKRENCSNHLILIVDIYQMLKL